MESRKTLMTFLKEVSSKFPDQSFGYSYDGFTAQHLVEVAPAEVFSNEGYVREEASLIFKFTSRFPTESVLFVPQGSDPTIESNEFIMGGVSVAL